MYNHARPPGYQCFVCKVVAGDTGDKAHYENLYDLEDTAALDIHRLYVQNCYLLKEALACDGTSTCNSTTSPLAISTICGISTYTSSRGRRRQPVRVVIPRVHTR